MLRALPKAMQKLYQNKFWDADSLPLQFFLPPSFLSVSYKAALENFTFK